MKSLREPLTVRSVELRTTIGVAPATLTDICKKVGIESPIEDQRRGSAKHFSSYDVRKILEFRGFAFPNRAEVIAMMICKGGVGKTTSTFYLAQRLAAYGANVLAIDGDSQGNLTSAFNLEQYGIVIDEETPVLMDIINDQCIISDAIISITPNLHLVPSSPLNSNLDGKIREKYKNPSLAVKKAIRSILNNYDFILIDCAPALNLTNTAIACASDVVILPVAPDKFSQLGLEQTLQELGQIEQDFSIKLDKKIIFTKYDGREFTSLKYLTEIADKYNNLRLNTAIRTSADVKNAITKKEDLFSYKKSNAKEDYDNFAREIMGLDKHFARKASQNNLQE